MDILILTIPKVQPDAPLIGPALLKANLLQAGFECKTIDLNIKLFKFLSKHNTQHYYYYENDSVFRMDSDDYSEEFLSFFEQHRSFFDFWINEIKSYNPKVIGLSILSQYSYAFALKFSELIRNEIPNAKILWGGAGINGNIKSFYNQGKFDHYISGDGEVSIIDFMSKNFSAPGINSTEVNQVDFINSLLPDYDDVDWAEYTDPRFLKDVVYITATRGCVKKCSFCNVHSIWPKFKMRDPESLESEIELLSQKYGRNSFYFTDSLINGSSRHFNDILSVLERQKAKNPDFQWISQWVLKPKKLSKESTYKRLADSGCNRLDIGIESFNEHIRAHMGKYFSDEDLFWNLEMFEKYKISTNFLMIVGYPIETDEDHNNTIRTIKRLFDLGYPHFETPSGRPLLEFNFGSILMLEKGDPLWGLVKDDVTEYIDSFRWTYKDNTLEKRVNRLAEIKETLEELYLKNHDDALLTRNFEHHKNLLI